MNPDLMEHILRGAPRNAPPVRITYRVKGQEQTTTREMEHRHYLTWLARMKADGYELLRVEQVRKG